MRFRTVSILALASAVMGFGIAIGVVAVWPDGSSSTQKQATAATATPVTSSGTTSGQTVANTSCQPAADIYEKLRPAVVKIIETSSGQLPFGQQSQGEGSGIVLDQQGHILTNYHVAGNATSLEVEFANGTTSAAHLVGSDPGDDLAVILVDNAQNLTPATLGDSGAVRVGESVLAIGDPFQLEGTLTAGIVSGLGRTFNPANSTRPILNMIQTDAPVNPGNSGGPLLDCQGKVIGIVTALENPTGQSVNVGVAFAVPSNTAQRFMSEMIAGKTISHPWLGIAGRDLTPALAAQVDVSVTSGVYVVVVSPSSPAEKAGLHPAFASENEAQQSTSTPSGGDVITKVDGQAVTGIQQLAAYLDTKRVGDSVELSLVRDGNTQSVHATLAEWPS